MDGFILSTSGSQLFSLTCRLNFAGPKSWLLSPYFSATLEHLWELLDKVPRALWGAIKRLHKVKQPPAAKGPNLGHSGKAMERFDVVIDQPDSGEPQKLLFATCSSNNRT